MITGIRLNDVGNIKITKCNFEGALIGCDIKDSHDIEVDELTLKNVHTGIRARGAKNLKVTNSRDTEDKVFRLTPAAVLVLQYIGR